MEQIKNAVKNILEDLEGFTFTEVTYILTEVKSKVEETTREPRERR